MGEVIPFRKHRNLEIVPAETDPEACGNCGHFALSNNGVMFCLEWKEHTDFHGLCDSWESPA